MRGIETWENKGSVGPSKQDVVHPSLSGCASQIILGSGSFSARANIKVSGQEIESNRHVITGPDKL